MTQVIRIKCPNLSCQRILAVPPHARGKLVRCRQCGSTVSIPAQKTEPVKGQAAEAEAES